MKTLLLTFISAVVAAGCAAAVEGDAVEATAAELDAVPVLNSRADAVIDPDMDATLFSGHGPNDASLTKSYTLNQALRGVTVGEDTDDPCYVEAKYNDVATDAAGTTKILDKCDGHKAGDLETLMLPADYFATGVRVCLNDDGDKVKGVELIGQHVDCLLGATSVMQRVSTCSPFNQSGLDYGACSDVDVDTACEDMEKSPSFERSNCQGSKNGPDGDWETERRCGDDEVVTGLEFGLENGSGNRKMIEGIALECRKISY